MKTKQRTQGIMIILQAIFSGHRQNREHVQFYKFLFFNKYLTNPYVHCSYSDVQNVQVVREFVRQLYGFDKGKILTFINKTRVQCECLMHIHQAQFIAPRTFISHCWSGLEPRFIRMPKVLEGFVTPIY